MRAGDVAVACGVASFWRGAWYVMDARVFPEDRAASALACGTLGPVAVAVASRAMRDARGVDVAGARFYALACVVACGSVATWRGVWTGWDEACARANAARDASARASEAETHLWGGVASLLVGAVGLIGAGTFASTFAPPVPMVYQRDAKVAGERRAGERMTWMLKRVGRFARF